MRVGAGVQGNELRGSIAAVVGTCGCLLPPCTCCTATWLQVSFCRLPLDAHSSSQATWGGPPLPGLAQELTGSAAQLDVAPSVLLFKYKLGRWRESLRVSTGRSDSRALFDCPLHTQQGCDDSLLLASTDSLVKLALGGSRLAQGKRPCWATCLSELINRPPCNLECQCELCWL